MRIDRFVRGHHDQRGDAVPVRGLSKKICPEGVVPDRGDGIFLHERNVFERGGVDNEIRRSFFKDFGEQRGIAQVSKYRRTNLTAWKRAQIEINLMEIVFGVIEKNERSRPAA